MRIAIIDDDFFARKNIIEQIDWEQLSYPEIKEYSNGFDLIADIDNEAFDIIITDIKMAEMDGIELAKTIQKKLPEIKIIFISAYPEKEYLKSAIKLKAVDFIEKPINMEDLQKALVALASVYNIEKGQISNNTITEQFSYLEKMNQMCNFLIHNKTYDLAYYQELAEYFHFRKNDYSYSVCLSFKLFDLKDNINVLSRLEINLLSALSGSLRQDNIVQFFTHKNDYLIVVLCAKRLSRTDFQDTIFTISNQYISFLNELGIKTVCGIGETVAALDSLTISYQQSIIALQQAYYSGKLLNYYTVPSSPAFNNGDLYLNEYKKLILFQKKDETLQLLEKLRNDISKNCNTLISDTVNIYYELLEFLWKQAQDMHLTIFNSIKTKTDLIAKLNSFFSFKDLCEYIFNVNEQFFSQLNKNDYGNKFVNIMANFIDKNYSNPNLQILTISENVHLTPNYASYIFKKYTNMTINQYLNNIRMQAAKRLLENSDYTVEYIASKVGFMSNAYFTKVFTKVFGLSPNEYRRRHNENKG